MKETPRGQTVRQQPGGERKGEAGRGRGEGGRSEKIILFELGQHGDQPHGDKQPHNQEGSVRERIKRPQVPKKHT